jgi:hypothetical protein
VDGGHRRGRGALCLHHPRPTTSQAPAPGRFPDPDRPAFNLRRLVGSGSGVDSTTLRPRRELRAPNPESQRPLGAGNHARSARVSIYQFAVCSIGRYGGRRSPQELEVPVWPLKLSLCHFPSALRPWRFSPLSTHDFRLAIGGRRKADSELRRACLRLSLRPHLFAAWGLKLPPRV